MGQRATKGEGFEQDMARTVADGDEAKQRFVQQRRLCEPDAVPLPEPCHSGTDEPDYRQHPERYEFPRFVIPTVDGPVAFWVAVPKE